MAMTVLVLGGYGTTGRMLSELLLEWSDVDVVVAGRDLGRAERAAGQLAVRYPGRVSARVADASDAASLDEAFAGVDLVAVAASVLAHADVVIEAALRAGIDYFDLLLPGAIKHVALERLRPRIETDGRCFITDGGIHPGLSAPVIRTLAPAFARLERVEVGALLRVDWPSYRFSVSTIQEFVDELLEYRMEALRDGVWTKLAWQDGMRTFDFGLPFGRERCAVMAMEELRGLPGYIPSLRDCAFYVAGFNPVVDNLIMPLGYAAVKAAPGVLGLPYARLLTWALRTFSRPPYGTIWQIEAEGESAGGPSAAGRRTRAGLRLIHPDGYWLTAATAVACLLQYLDGSLRVPGVHLQALAVEPVRLLRDLQRMGVRVESFGLDMGTILGGTP
ncbi:MAG TPA: saccharopine dehydrogenase NADP-binding domain-containing protein [Thermoleophilia bacterium]|nr:saccharopine dehydrogenase NADP-binding domain-containing protein [Thermoleophilia bacterium]